MIAGVGALNRVAWSQPGLFVCVRCHMPIYARLSHDLIIAE
jgi:hypothetical protein